MDSEIVTKINETENLKSVENSKENVPPAALDKTCEQEKVNEIGNQGEESVLEMATDIPVTKKEEVVEEVEVEKDGEETPLIDTKTITTDIITKKETNGENAKFEIKTTTTTTKTLLCEEKNGEDDPQVETQPTTITVADTIPSQLDESNIVSSENKKLEPEESLPIAVIADNQNMSNNSVGGNVNKSVKDTAESEESGDPSEDECTENDDDEEETDYKTEKIEDAKDSKSNQSSSVTANININAEEVMEKKVINENKDINNQIENIISDIDINIKAQEKITQLKEQELQLIQKQKQLANQIHQQQILAEKLIAENQLKEQELKSQQIKQFELQNRNQCKEEFIPIMPDENASLYNKQQDDFYNIRESSNLSRTVDLRKIFTPATDAPQIIPKNRKLYASSAFYSPTLHPTVEDQVELARRISHSLSDISNQKSKGQSMYDNRKKRSVKWVHEGSAQGEDDIIETKSLYKENAEENLTQELTKLDKMPLKLIMNPRGQLRDYNSLKESINIEAGLLSPDNCAELITALQLHKGRGAELFAKRRRKADNWVVDETNAGTYSPSGIPDYQQYQTKPATSPNILPAYSDAGKHRVQLNLHQDQLIEKYSKPGVQVVKSPWEAALQTGSASSAFFQETKFGGQSPMTSVASPVHCNQDVNDNPGLVQTHSLSPSACGTPSNNIAQDSYKNTFETRSHNQPIQPCNPQRELAYKPSVAQGWGGRNVELPRGLYVPKEISLASYAPPPAQARDKQFTPNYQGPTKADFVKEYSTDARETFHGFPVSNVTSGLYLSQPPKQQLLAPLSYQNLPANSMQTAPQVNFNPSPLSFEKLSKFEDLDQRNSGISSPRYLNISKQPGYNGVRNVTPTPFGSTEDRSTFENLQSSPISTIPKKFGCYRQSTQNAQEYLTTRSPNGQSFNKCARGWNNGSAAERKVFCPKGQFVPSHSLPYSDF